jgi:hypothetical protein
MTAYVFADGGFPATPSVDDTLSMGSTLYEWSGSAWDVVATGTRSPISRQFVTATAGQTSITGLTYAPGTVDVHSDGFLLLEGDDYTASDGASIQFTQPLLTGQEIILHLGLPVSSEVTLQEMVEDAEVLSLIGI